MTRTTAARNLLLGMLLMLALLVIIGFTIVYTGGYNVAATEEHTSLTRWAFDSTMHESIERRAQSIDAPSAFTAAMVASGAEHYKPMCQHCHGGPNVERSEWALGMRPLPPLLTEAAVEWDPRELFWIVKHGIKMTGMPAFGPTHDDRTLWNIVALVRELPAMTPERYESLGGEHHGDHHHATPSAPAR